MYDIYAYDDNGKEIAYLGTGMRAFRELIQLGYFWFELIDATECDGGVSGMGIDKKIKLVNLLNAMKKLKSHQTKGEWIEDWDGLRLYTSVWKYRKRALRKFMRKCINWCILNNKDEILIGFY